MEEDLPIFKFAVREDLLDIAELVLPKRSTPKALGWDVKAFSADRNPIKINAHEYVKIPLGFRCICPDGWGYTLVPRSSTFFKKKLNCLYGQIDEDFFGYVALAAKYDPSVLFANDNNNNNNNNNNNGHYTAYNDMCLIINFGDPIAQIIPVRRREMIIKSITNEEFSILEEDRKTNRNPKGFGSTIKK